MAYSEQPLPTVVIFVKRTMVFLDDAQHEGLRRLAFERRCTMAALIREALEADFGEKMNDRIESGIACRSCLDT